MFHEGGMNKHPSVGPSRRQLLRNSVLAVPVLALQSPFRLYAQSLPVIDVASAGSMRAVLDGPLRTAVAQGLHLNLRLRSGGADAVARSIVDASAPADVFLSVTAGPMLTVLRSGKAKIAYPIATTEMVIVYSPRSRFASEFAAAAEGRRNWWEVLQKPGVRFARSNPADDPSGRSILFTMMLAAKRYGRADLVQRTLGAVLNPAQIELGKNVRAGLESGDIDAAGSYKIATGPGKFPFIRLPADINLSDEHLRARHPELSLTAGGQTFYPEPLVFYAAALEGAGNSQSALQFLDWLRGKDAAQLLQANGYDSAEGLLALQAAPA